MSKSGFVFFKDQAVVILYSNILGKTPHDPIQWPDGNYIISKHVFALVSRWLDHESVRQSMILFLVLCVDDLYMTKIWLMWPVRVIKSDSTKRL